MDCLKNSTNLAILSLMLATVIFITSTQNSSYKSSLLFSRNPPKVSDSPESKDELQIALEKASMPNKTVIIVIINEAYVEPQRNEYPTMFDLFLEGFWAGEGVRSLVDHLLVVAMDEKAYERCEFRRMNCYKIAGGGGGDFSGEKVYMSGGFIEMMWRRTGFLLEVLKRGYSFIFTDADIIWLRNPFIQLSISRSLDLQISTDSFNGNSTSIKNSINTGFYLVRANNRTVSLFGAWHASRANSTGLKEQDVLARMVRHGSLGKLGIRVAFLNTRYFSGFCRRSNDINNVVTVHANCCRTIRAKVIDLKSVLADWRKWNANKNSNTNSRNINNTNNISNNSSKIDNNNNNKNGTISLRKFRWSDNAACKRSWA